MTEKTITFDQAISQVIDQLDRPTPVDEVVQRVLDIWLSQAKNPAKAVRDKIRQMYDPTWVWLDPQTLVPLQVSMQGVRFRITPSRSEVERAMVMAMPAFHAFLNDKLSLDAIQLIDASGKPLNAKPTATKEKIRSFFGDRVVDHMGFGLGVWFKRVGFRRGDSILVTIEDWATGRFRFDHEPANKRQRSEIQRKNQELADLLFALLEADQDQEVSDTQTVQTAYARMAEPGGYPGDHWTEVVELDPRMKWVFDSIRYADSKSAIESMFEENKPVAQVPILREQGLRVYRFKAQLKRRAGLWRRIEIQGEQTLADFDRVLRDAFDHDSYDHLGGFWKRVRRGDTQRFRKIDLGHVSPFGDGDGASVQVAGLGLQPGDELNYVYDFGDWIEHTVVLEEIVEPEIEIPYPRIVEKNKPRYRYCERCDAEGRRTIATQICIECSDRQQRQVLICDTCLDKAHDEHLADELLY